jgi:hypothetical protein
MSESTASRMVSGIIPGMVNTHVPTPDELNAMTPGQYKGVENRLRAAAERQGLRLEKSRSRDPRAIGWGTYQLVDLYHNTPVAYGLQDGYGLGLDDVARALFREQS